jgi:hypothetical protein
MKSYKPKSLKGAQEMVRRLRKQIEVRDKLLKQFHFDLVMLAQLACETPQFENWLDVMKAKKIRDRILKKP